MLMTAQMALFKTAVQDVAADDWTFHGASTRGLTHCYHDYPARMIPQVAGKLLDMFGKNAKLLFDPYCGTGTSLIEASLRKINALGTDINPLARLISQAKTATPDLGQIDRWVKELERLARRYSPGLPNELPLIDGITNLNFWFKEVVIARLHLLRNFIQGIDERDVRLFFQVAFSETVRESSNTRNEEFKLYRYEKLKLASFEPDVFATMLGKLRRNRRGLHEYLDMLGDLSKKAAVSVCGFNSVVGIPGDCLADESVDIVLTSPPYGDSRTTVAYGQYSRLSSAWLGLAWFGASGKDR